MSDRMNNVVKIIFLVSLSLCAVSFFMKKRLPSSNSIVEQLQMEPVQTEIPASEFKIKKRDREYTVKPLYEYELYGLVVSMHDAGSWMDSAHKRWGDSLNIRDLCVLWGGNVKNDLYREFKFWSAEWTCYYKTGGDAAWNAFKAAQFSNNHLLVDDEKLARVILSVRRGDQIHLKGYLSEYSHDGGFKRGTSTTRTDTANNSCETIFITDFEILKRANLLWNYLFAVTKYLAAACAVLLVIMFFRSPGRVSD